MYNRLDDGHAKGQTGELGRAGLRTDRRQRCARTGIPVPVPIPVPISAGRPRPWRRGAGAAGWQPVPCAVPVRAAIPRGRVAVLRAVLSRGTVVAAVRPVAAVQSGRVSGTATAAAAAVRTGHRGGRVPWAATTVPSNGRRAVAVLQTARRPVRVAAVLLRAAAALQSPRVWQTAGAAGVSPAAGRHRRRHDQHRHRLRAARQQRSK